MKTRLSLSTLLVSIVLAATTAAQDAVRLKLLDAFSGHALVNADVEIFSDSGIRCESSPCDTGAVTWKGKSDANGYVIVPHETIKQVTSVQTSSHKGELEQDSERDRSGAQLVELFSRELDSGGPMDLGFSHFKMIDARTGQAIANAPVRIEFGRGEKLELRTNSLGYIFVPMGSAMAVLENTWATIPGYRRKKLDYGGVFHKTRMEKAS